MKQHITVLCLLLAAAMLLSACALIAGPTSKESTQTKPTDTQTVSVADSAETPPQTDPADWSELVGRGGVGTVLPDFIVTAADGSTFTLSEALADHKLVLINLWATWCGPCVGEFSFLEEAYQTYGDRVAVIALSVEQTDTLEVLRDFAQSKGLSFSLARDEERRLARTFHVTNIPTSLLVNQNREVVWLETGAMASAQGFQDVFDAYLQGGDSQNTAYAVRIVDQNGDPVPGVIVNFCTDTACTPVTSDQNGQAVYTGQPYAYHVQVLSVPEGYDYTGEAEMVLLAGGDEVTVTATKLG